MKQAVVALLLLAACSPEPAPKPARSAAEIAAADRAAAKARDAKANPYPVYRVAVAPGGLLLTDPASGAAKPAAFGLRQSLLIAILARSFGPATEGREAGCERDFARWDNGLTVWFDAGSFVGWSLAGTDPRIAIAPGMVRAPIMGVGAICNLPV